MSSSETQTRSHRIFKQVEGFMKNNSLYHNTLHQVLKSENNNTLNIYGYEINSTHRKLGVLTLSVACTLRLGAGSKPPVFAFRRLAVYFTFFSLLLCRENLNPYAN